MADEGRISGSRQTIRASQDELLLQAASVLRNRYERDGCEGLTANAAKELGQTLRGIAEAEHPDEARRSQAIALAHRLLDNDCPELSEMWPEPSEQH